MKLFDFHVHSNFSGDCKTEVEDVILYGIKNKVDTICFTDHYDYDYPYKNTSFTIDFSTYFETIGQLQEKYRDKINVLIGIEAGIQPHIVDTLNKQIKKYPFDFVIASTHVVDGLDPYYGEYFIGKTQYQSYYRYFEDILNSVKTFDDYDVYGHLDYIIRYGEYEAKTLSNFDYDDILDEILKTIINSDHGIEINTSGFKYGLNQSHPNEKIIKRYRELGGEIITIGSDAHLSEYLCYEHKRAMEILTQCGFKYVTYFKKRKPSFIKIEL